MSDDHADKIKVAIGDLLREADPTSKLIISAYSQVAQHTANVKTLSSSKFKSDQLQLCAEFLRLKIRDENDEIIFTTKSTLADRIVTKIESFFPSTCHECKEEYQVKYSDVESRRFQCFLCLQPSHDCEALTQAIDSIDSSPNEPIGRVWLCSGCYDKNNPMASNRRRRSNSVVFDNITTPLNTPRSSPAPSPPPPGNDQTIEQGIDDRHDVQLPSTQTSLVSSNSEICPRYTKNQCPHGMNGKKVINGQDCSFSHPRRCKRFCMFGPRRKGGCNKGNDCTFYHPKLCHNALRNSTCLNENCTFVHTKGTKRRRANSPQGQSRPEHSSRDRHPRSRRPSQSRENPRQESRPRSGHPQHSTDRQRSRPQYPDNHPSRHHDYRERLVSTSSSHRPATPTAASNNNATEVSFLVRMLQNMKSDFQTEINQLKLSIAHQIPAWNPQTLRPQTSFQIPSHHPDPQVPIVMNQGLPLWNQNIPQFAS